MCVSRDKRSRPSRRLPAGHCILYSNCCIPISGTASPAPPHHHLILPNRSPIPRQSCGCHVSRCPPCRFILRKKDARHSPCVLNPAYSLSESSEYSHQKGVRYILEIHRGYLSRARRSSERYHPIQFLCSLWGGRRHCKSYAFTAAALPRIAVPQIGHCSVFQINHKTGTSRDMAILRLC